MRTYNYLEAQKNFASVLNFALTQEVIIKEKNGRRFKIILVDEVANRSPFEVSGINTDISTNEVLEFLRESRSSSPLV